MTDILALVGRLMLGILFLWASGAKIFHWKMTSDYMHSRNVPASLLPAAILLQLLGGLSLILGYYIRIGACLLIVFMIPAIFKAHNFWNLKDPERMKEKIYFMTDLGLLGGLLYVLAYGAGRFSL